VSSRAGDERSSRKPRRRTPAWNATSGLRSRAERAHIADQAFGQPLWDGEGSGNCWSGNTGARGRRLSYDARGSGRSFPACPADLTFAAGDTGFHGRIVTCLTWDPSDYDEFPPCGAGGDRYENWFVLPPAPR